MPVGINPATEPLGVEGRFILFRLYQPCHGLETFLYNPVRISEAVIFKNTVYSVKLIVLDLTLRSILPHKGKSYCEAVSYDRENLVEAVKPHFSQLRLIKGNTQMLEGVIIGNITETYLKDVLYIYIVKVVSRNTVAILYGIEKSRSRIINYIGYFIKIIVNQKLPPL